MCQRDSVCASSEGRGRIRGEGARSGSGTHDPSLRRGGGLTAAASLRRDSLPSLPTFSPPLSRPDGRPVCPVVAASGVAAPPQHNCPDPDRAPMTNAVTESAVPSRRHDRRSIEGGTGDQRRHLARHESIASRGLSDGGGR